MKMNLYILAALGVALSLHGRVYGFLGLPLHAMTPEQVIQTANNELYKEVMRPNKWKYKYNFLFFPRLRRMGISHFLDGSMSVFDIKFTSHERAEKLFLDIYQDFILRLNSVRMIRPFLVEFPLTSSAVQMYLSFRDENGNCFLPPCIDVAKFDGENFTCTQHDHTTSGIVFQKPASEVDWIKTLSSVGVERKALGKKIVFPVVTRTEDGDPVSEVVFSFFKVFCEKNQLAYVTEGIGKYNCDSRPYEVVLRGMQNVDLQAARKLAASCSNGFFDLIRTNKDTIAYVKKRKAWTGELFPRDFPEPCHIAYRIGFWDEYVDRVCSPNIAEIRVAGESFKYYTADEGQRLVLVYEETWDDAMKFLEQETKGTEKK